MVSAVQRENSLPRYIVGVDEAGRGPIAGPVTVAAVALLKPLGFADFNGVNDSKKLSEKKREHFRRIIEGKASVADGEGMGMLSFAVRSVPADVIDRDGIVFSIQLALASALGSLALPPARCRVMLDGALKAPPQYVHQETIVKGDETELPIMLAGIVAKTTRDKEMAGLAHHYPAYGFEQHKGYGTKRHYEAIQTAGLCALHRRSFIHLTD